MTMECREVRPLIEAFVSEQLLVETTQGIVAHVERCHACRAEVDGLRRLRMAMRSAFAGAEELTPRPEFIATMTAGLRADVAHPPRAVMPRRRWLALAASLILVVGAGVGLREWAAASLSALLHAAVGDHRFCALTFKLAERPIPLEEAASRYGGVYARLATVEPPGPTLGGEPLRIVERHSCVFDGRRFGHLVLRYKDQLVSLLVAEDPRTGARFIGSQSDGVLAELPMMDGFQVASFRGPHHVVFIVSSLSQADVQDIAQAMTAPVSRALAGA